MIHKVKISNFKSINELDLELGRVNVLIGENGCGKTNILEAIALGSVAADGGYNDVLLAMRGVRITEAHLMSSLFAQNKDRTSVIFFNKKNDHIETGRIYDTSTELALSGKFHAYASYEQAVPQVEEQAIDYYKNRTAIAKLFDDDHLLSYCIFRPENRCLRRFEDDGEIKPLGIRGEGLFKHIVLLHKKHPDIIQKISKRLRLIDSFLGFEIPNDLTFTEKRLNIKDKYLEDLAYYDQSSTSEGFLRLLFYFTLFMSPYTPGFFAIDNIDAGLNPKLADKLITVLSEIAKEHNKQFIATAHNPALLDGIDLKDETQKLFVIARNIDDETFAHKVRPLQKVDGREPVRTSEAFIRGYLGGLAKIF